MSDRVAIKRAPRRKSANPKPHNMSTTRRQGLRKLKKDVSMLKKQVISNVEVKNDYISFPLQQIDWDGAITTPVQTISQGVDVDARIGRSLRCKGIDFRYHVGANNNNPTFTGNAIRVVVVLDHDASLTQTSDLMYNGLAGFTVGTSRAPLSFYNRNNRPQFTILHDKIHEFDYASGNLQQYEKVTLKTKHKVTYVDNSTLVAENAIRVFMISDKPVAAGDRPYIEWVMNYYYTDE